jgi:flagellar basal-body rod modification protein FlgD
MTRVKGDTSHSLQFRLSKDAEDVKLDVKNPNGEVVRSFTMKQLKAGANSIEWNGQDERGITQPPGEYTVSIDAKDRGGQKVGSETQFDGLITGVNYTAEGPLLLIGNRSVKFSDVRRIVDPRLRNDDQKNETATSQDLKVSSQPKETIKGNLDQISMSRGMINKVEKETGKEVAL